MQKGADIARMSADIALLEDNIARVTDAKTVANTTMRPVAAATLHNGSTIAILLNALLAPKTAP